ncbi:MAG: sarcosine oxidase subunit delta [Alphaproteobacteria bacterium]|nr:sarcosine oxidase subunit delta [Alphaproteobacteria bacterium]
MRLKCPYCGDRNVGEFTSFGEQPALRPDGANGDDQSRFVDYVYMRDNRAGPNRELWYHGQGCRQWLRVLRDTKTHEFLTIELARRGDQNDR